MPCRASLRICSPMVWRSPSGELDHGGLDPVTSTARGPTGQSVHTRGCSGSPVDVRSGDCNLVLTWL